MTRKFIKLIIILLRINMLIPVSISYAGSTMYSLDSRTIDVPISEVEAYKAVNWYTEPVTLMYASDGRTLVVLNSEVDLYKVGTHHNASANLINMSDISPSSTAKTEDEEFCLFRYCYIFKQYQHLSQYIPPSVTSIISILLSI